MEDLDLKELEQYHGTENYYRGFLGVNYTDGVEYITINGYSWFVTDSIAVLRTKLKNEEFLSISLKVNADKAVMIITDGNGKILYKQDYNYTDISKYTNLIEIKLYLIDGVLLLPSEY